MPIGSRRQCGSAPLSLCGILISAQQISVLILLGDVPKDPQSSLASKAIQRYLPQLLLSEQGPARPSDMDRYRVGVPVGSWTLRWKSVFTWQCPMMFAGYSVLAYVVGLTILVSTPLIRKDPWGSCIKCESVSSQLPFKANNSNFAKNNRPIPPDCDFLLCCLCSCLGHLHHLLTLGLSAH